MINPQTLDFNAEVKCFCGQCKEKNNGEEDKFFECSGCKRTVPYCFGGSNLGFEEFCDDCWYALDAQKKDE